METCMGLRYLKCEWEKIQIRNKEKSKITVLKNRNKAYFRLTEKMEFCWRVLNQSQRKWHYWRQEAQTTEIHSQGNKLKIAYANIDGFASTKLEMNNYLRESEPETYSFRCENMERRDKQYTGRGVILAAECEWKK